jgi:electron transfer flavoprotein alpha subunit
MKLIVCIKQVPDVADVKFDDHTKTIVRVGVTNIVSPFDRRGLAEAIRIRELLGGEVVVVTMGPPQARDALIECLGAGADRAIHLVDPAFAGSDTLATSRVLATALKREGFDIIFCGKYSIDAETGQVGPEVAEFLAIPQVTGATRIEFSPDLRKVVVERETDDGFEILECELPLLVTAAERLVRPIKVKDPQIEIGRTKPIVELSAAELQADSDGIGLAGSPTRVTEIRSVARQRQVEMIEGSNVQELADRLIDKLLANGSLRGTNKKSETPKAPDNSESVFSDREVWAVAELIDQQLRPVSLELLAKGRELASKLNASVAAVVAGSGVSSCIKTLAWHGADKIYLADDELFRAYTTEAYTSLLTEVIREYKPEVVLLPATSNGRDLSPRVAARLGIGLTADCVDLDISADGELIQYKPAFGGNIVALILSRTRPQMATVKPGMLGKLNPNESRRAAITPITKPITVDERVRLIEVRKEVPAEIVELDEAETVVCVGTGVGGPDNLPRIHALARSMNAVIGATRRVVDQGWLPRHYQIGLTGKIIAPRLYFGIGVRGAFNHTIGVQRAGTIVAINSDPDADIFKTADVGVVADWAEIVPLLTSGFQNIGTNEVSPRLEFEPKRLE